MNNDKSNTFLYCSPYLILINTIIVYDHDLNNDVTWWIYRGRTVLGLTGMISSALQVEKERVF